MLFPDSDITVSKTKQKSTNKNRELSPDEVGELLGTMGVRMQGKELDNLIRLMDKDASGEISLDELAGVMLSRKKMEKEVRVLRVEAHAACDKCGCACACACACVRCVCAWEDAVGLAVWRAEEGMDAQRRVWTRRGGSGRASAVRWCCVSTCALHCCSQALRLSGSQALSLSLAVSQFFCLSLHVCVCCPSVSVSLRVVRDAMHMALASDL
eukprot:1437545-Rhodomonas_salina.2